MYDKRRGRHLCLVHLVSIISWNIYSIYLQFRKLQIYKLLFVKLSTWHHLSHKRCAVSEGLSRDMKWRSDSSSHKDQRLETEELLVFLIHRVWISLYSWIFRRYINDSRLVVHGPFPTHILYFLEEKRYIFCYTWLFVRKNCSLKGDWTEL